MGEIAVPFGGTYSATKAAMTAFSDALRMELAPFNINVVIVKAGAVKSELVNNAKEKTEK
jgi:short-subunit dehydrogenase